MTIFSSSLSSSSPLEREVRYAWCDTGCGLMMLLAPDRSLPALEEGGRHWVAGGRVDG